MGLKDDMEALQRHIDNGTAKEFMEGTAKPLPKEPMPLDTSIGKKGYAWERERGD